nr:MAG TPA: Pectate lyase [Caudoviricetes sp.]
MSIISEIAQGLSSIIKKNDELFMKKADAQSLLDSIKSINVVTEGVDNTGTTDVTAKLNEIFTKANAEKYDEVIFPDGIYKIENVVKIFCPEKRVVL